jgi:hypothetical protein
MNDPAEIWTPRLLDEDLSVALAAVDAIPDGIRLADFPSHHVGPTCWCRPHVLFLIDRMVVRHKDLPGGEFDC